MDMDMDMEQALQTYVEEARELLQEMEASLLSLESDPGNSDRINAIFRAAHTIKGSAGLFGLDFIVKFTHVVESVLDRVRNGELTVTNDLTNLLLACKDHITALIDLLAGGSTTPSQDMQTTEQGLLGFLSHFMADSSNSAKPSSAPVAVPQPGVEVCRGGPVGTGNWHISLRFGRNVLRNGMDPLSFIRYLGTLGSIVSLNTIAMDVPPLAELEPEECYLGFEIDLQSEAGKEAIDNAFEFVRDDCVVHILPPRSCLDEFAQLIKSLPEDNLKLGEILVASGALTQRELEEALRLQQEAAAEENGHQPKLGEILVETGHVQEQLVEAAVKKQESVKEARSRESQHVRVRADRLDQLINLVGELVIAGASATLLARRAGDRAFQEAASNISRMVEEIRDGALQLRMVPIGETFSKFQRVVRDVSQEIGKDIDLKVSGGDTELDKTVVEKIGDPLTHLVRNSMDHGIELAETRRARNKPARATVRLNAYHDSGNIVIEVADDGGGLNREKIMRKAIERGLVSPDQSLSDQEIFNLIFEPGFSTADQVTNLSGRGVGMDVVKRNITALRGTVDIESTEGVGTVVRIRLPLTLAIIDGFLVGVGNFSYVIPLDMVVECVEMDARAGNGLRHDHLNLRGEVLPLVRLREHFEVRGSAPRRENVVVAQYAGHKAGFVVDTLLGEFQTVIKPLGKLFSGVRGLSGSTILGSGEVALILDVPGMVQQAKQYEARSLGGSVRQPHEAFATNLSH